MENSLVPCLDATCGIKKQHFVSFIFWIHNNFSWSTGTPISWPIWKKMRVKESVRKNKSINA